MVVFHGVRAIFKIAHDGSLSTSEDELGAGYNTAMAGWPSLQVRCALKNPRNYEAGDGYRP